MDASSCGAYGVTNKRIQQEFFRNQKALCNKLHRSTFHISLLMHRLVRCIGRDSTLCVQ